MEPTLRHTTIKNQGFIFSLEEDTADYYSAAYSLTKKLLIGMAQESKKFANNKFNIAEAHFLYTERQLDGLVLPLLNRLCNGMVMVEIPVKRNINRGEYQVKDSSGRIDYWCVYKGYSFVIEMKHSYDCYKTDQSRYDRFIKRWKYMNKSQLASIKNAVKNYEEETLGVIRLALHFVTSYSDRESGQEEISYYRDNEKEIMRRIWKDLSKYSNPDFIGCWEIDDDIVEQFEHTYPGLILISKFNEPIVHKGAIKK